MKLVLSYLFGRRGLGLNPSINPTNQSKSYCRRASPAFWVVTHFEPCSPNPTRIAPTAALRWLYMRKYILIFLMLLSCTPASVHQAKLLRMRVGSAYGDLWEIRQLQDRMTGEHTLYAASPLVFAEGRDLISYMSVECGTTIGHLCLLALSFPGIEQNSQVSDDPISFRVRFDLSEPERFNFIRTQKLIRLTQREASRLFEN